jgi:hypothetical protein
MFNALRNRLMSGGGNALLRTSSNIGRRTYLTSKEFSEKVPEDVQKALEKTGVSTQPQGVGVCTVESEKNRVALQKELRPDANPKPTESTYWTDDSAKEVMKGHPARVTGHGLGTPDSEWTGHHSVVVASPTKQSQGKPLTKQSEFVVLDPDTTHDKRTLEAAQRGVLEPSDSTRIMTHEQLSDARPRVYDNGQFDEVLPMTRMTTDKGPPKSFLERLFFGNGENNS